MILKYTKWDTENREEKVIRDNIIQIDVPVLPDEHKQQDVQIQKIVYTDGN